MRFDDPLISMFHSTVQVEPSNGETLVEVPDSEIEMGPLAEGKTYRIAVLGPVEGSNNSTTEEEALPDSQDSQEQITSGSASHPVSEGERIEVDILDMGDEGDGIAKIDGYAIIVPGVDVGEKVEVEITNVRPSHAFAETIASSSKYTT